MPTGLGSGKTGKLPIGREVVRQRSRQNAGGVPACTTWKFGSQRRMVDNHDDMPDEMAEPKWAGNGPGE